MNRNAHELTNTHPCITDALWIICLPFISIRSMNQLELCESRAICMYICVYQVSLKNYSKQKVTGTVAIARAFSSVFLCNYKRINKMKYCVCCAHLIYGGQIPIHTHTHTHAPCKMSNMIIVTSSFIQFKICGSWSWKYIYTHEKYKIINNYSQFI